MNKKYLEETNAIASEELLELVTLSVVRNFLADVPFIKEWIKGSVSKQPLEIFDVNGKPLFYDYAIKKGSDTLGYVRASANAILGDPVVSYEVTQRVWDADSAVKKITSKVKKEYPRNKILGTKIVCYSYPKIGVMFDVTDNNAKPSKLIFDIMSGTLIPEKNEKIGVEGIHAWSYFDSVPEGARKNRLKVFDSSNKFRLSLPAKFRDTLRKPVALEKYLPELEKLVKLNLGETKQLQFCTHYNYNETRSHHCFSLHAQQKNDYCAVATCQMILCYYRYYYSQDGIAPALNYSPGGCPADHSAGYEQLSNNHLDATYDASPTWDTARNQIRLLHPFKSGVPGHARACAGYSYSKMFSIAGKISITEKKLFIYDPWMWNVDYKAGGSVYWENWDTVTHTNYILTALKMP